MADTATLRIIDAALNRAGEGLRVVEDYLRFVLDDPFLTRQVKSIRHDLAAGSAEIASAVLHSARDTAHDVGTSISSQSENRRADAWSVCAASLKRVEQSLRSLEEYGKLLAAPFAAEMKSLRYRFYTLEKAIDTGRSSREQLDHVRLCVLVDGRESAQEFEQLVRELVAAGPLMIQLRDKSLDDRQLIERARLLVSLTRPTAMEREGKAPTEPRPKAQQELRSPKTLAVINDRADVAAIVQADGVHLGQEDLSVKDARAIVGPRMLLGVSTHHIEQARAAVLDGASYLGAGPTFPSRTKDFDHFAGLDYLRQVAAEIRLPTFAIGGITPDNLHSVLTTGVQRVAVSSAVTSATEPGSAARQMLIMLNDANEPQRVVR